MPITQSSTSSSLNTFNNEDPLTPHPQSLFSFKGVVAAIVLAFVAFLAALVGFLSQKPMPADQPVIERAVGETSCQGRTGNSLQTCCESELTARAGMRAACVGTWEIKNNQCSWTCTTTTP